MPDEKVLQSPVDRRGFLRGSAIFAAALGLGVATSAFGQEQQPERKPEEKDEPKDEKGENGGKKGDSETKIDADGREYRVCPQCAANMYRQGRTWTCENCGYSYVE